jgi:acetyltransferase-like isoleucine patch superfamily enzyme
MIRKLASYLAHRNKALWLYRRLCRPSGREWAEHLRRFGGLYHLGTNCSILPSARIIDPAYTWIGDRVCLGNCTLICHDGSIETLQQRYGVRLDRIGPVILESDVYVGEGAMILGGGAGTRIGEGSIIGAGAVVRQSMPPGSVAMGNPAKVVSRVKDMLRFWEAEMIGLPWADLIAQRDGAYDAAMEPELQRLRQEYFFSRKSELIGGFDHNIAKGQSR